MASTRRCDCGFASIRSFMKICFTCASTVLRHEQPRRDRFLREALGDQAEDLTLTVGQLVERVLPAAPPDEARDDRRVDP